MTRKNHKATEGASWNPSSRHSSSRHVHGANAPGDDTEAAGDEIAHAKDGVGAASVGEGARTIEERVRKGMRRMYVRRRLVEKY